MVYGFPQFFWGKRISHFEGKKNPFGGGWDLGPVKKVAIRFTETLKGMVFSPKPW